MSVAELLRNATGDKESKLYIKSKQCYYELNDEGTDVKILDNGPPSGSKVLDAAAICRTDYSFIALLNADKGFRLCVWRGQGTRTVYEESIKPQPEDVKDEEIELELICENDKFLGIGTVIVANHELYGSSSYYEWDGNNFSYVNGDLDNWYAAEESVEMYISEDGQSLEERSREGIY